MKKLIISAMLGLAIILGLAAQPATAVAPKPVNHQLVIKVYPGGKLKVTRDGKVVRDDRIAASAVSRDTLTSAGPFNGVRFSQAFTICLWDMAGTTWPIYDAGNAFESGTATVGTGYRTAAQGCPDFTESQRLRFHTYSQDDGACETVVGGVTQVGPYEYYNEIWNGSNGGPQVFMNTYYYAMYGCRDTAQHRAYNVSQGIGVALGLAVFNFGAGTHSIMNEYYQNTYSFAGTFDRNNLFALY